MDAEAEEQHILGWSTVGEHNASVALDDLDPEAVGTIGADLFWVSLSSGKRSLPSTRLMPGSEGTVISPRSSCMGLPYDGWLSDGLLGRMSVAQGLLSSFASHDTICESHG